MNLFAQVVGTVMAFLGVSAFAKDQDGKTVLLDEQKKKLEEKYGEKFLKSFLEDLATAEESGEQPEALVTEKVKAELDDVIKMKAELERARAEAAKAKEAFEKMSKEKSAERVDAESSTQGEIIRDGLDMSMAHNRYAVAVMEGKGYHGDDTIKIDEVQKAFGKYVTGDRLNIMNSLLVGLESVKYMSTIISDKTEIRAGKSAISSVLQQFTAKWTPKGKTEFTPLVVKNYKLKINVPITPAEIMDEYIGYLYDEKLQPKDMPIVKYILFVLIKPKLDEDRERALACGEFQEHAATEDGQAGSDAMHAVEGYWTQLVKLKKTSDNKVTWLQDSVAKLDEDNILDTVDKAVTEVSPLYSRLKLNIHADPNLITMYGKAYRKKYPFTKNEDGEKVKVDFSNFTFVPLEGMRGTGGFFITPKENFKHILSQNPATMNIWMQAQNYDVKIFAEWWEGTGFWLKEAIFAYVPDAQESHIGV